MLRGSALPVTSLLTAPIKKHPMVVVGGPVGEPFRAWSSPSWRRSRPVREGQGGPVSFDLLRKATKLRR